MSTFNRSNGIAVSQDHQRSSASAHGFTEISESSTFHHDVSHNPLEIKSKDISALPSSTSQSRFSIFSQNVAPPTLSIAFPTPGTRFKNITQLACCGNLLRKCFSLSSTAASTRSELLDPAQRALIEPYAQNEDEYNHIHSLIQRVVAEFTDDNLKTTATLSEVLLLAPSLDLKDYRKLLNCLVAEFETARLLDLALLQGLVQLVESASPDYLQSEDLVRILAVIRTCLQDTHQHSTNHLYYLIWSLSRLLDVVVEGKVMASRRVIDQERLFALVRQLKTSKDLILKRQVTYAFQGLLHIPNDESNRQRMPRNSGNITMGLFGTASVCKLDPGNLKDGTHHLYDATRETYEVDTKDADGVRPLFESIQGTWDSVKGDIISGRRNLWYTSLREAQQLIRNGRLEHFKNLIYEAPCRDHVDFQWGICRLLGEIAVDPLWETSVRQQAIDFLTELYKDGWTWPLKEGIHRWILEILRMIVSLEDTAISEHALLLLQGLKQAGDATKQELYRDAIAGPLCSYPIQVRLPLPTSSTLLSRVLVTPLVEYDLLRLKDLRFEEKESVLYIQPQATPNLQASDDTLFPLMEEALKFLAGPGLVFLLLGDSGGGKSTFNLQLERTLWKSYKKGGPIPLHINLPSIDNPEKDLIVKQLQMLDFTDTQIMDLKKNRQFIVICDGYDESQLAINIHSTNLFNNPGQWKVKMVITCRTQYLGPYYRNFFMPQGSTAYHPSTANLFQEAVIAPFTKEQIERYVDIYVPLEPRTWDAKDYMDRLTAIPNLMDLVKNPFLLSLALAVLPGVTKDTSDLTTIKVTRVQLYDIFVQQWLEVNQKRLLNNNALSSENRKVLLQLLDANFVSLGIEYSIKLALAIMDKQDGHPVVHYVHLKDKNTWKAEFFGSQPEIRLLRDSSPLNRAGNYFNFLHRSILEYFVSRAIFAPAEYKEGVDAQPDTGTSALLLIPSDNSLFQKNLIPEPSIISFLCDRVKLNPDLKYQLHAVIEQSKTDNNAAIAAANAIAILVRAGVSFNGADLRGVRIPNADLSGGQFDSAQFQGANLTGVNLSRSWLRQADMRGAHMEGVRFGELPYLKMNSDVFSCAYSPDGKMLAVAFTHGTDVYDTATWSRLYTIDVRPYGLRSIVFSPDSQRLVSSRNKIVRLWDTASGGEVLVLEGHRRRVTSLTISPCGNRIASAGFDKMVRLWNAHTGVKLFEKSYISRVPRAMSVKFSPDGSQLVVGCKDGTIEFLNPVTEELKILLTSCGCVDSLAYSPDGRWVAAGHEGGHLQLWDALSFKPGPTLSGHTSNVTGIDFSRDGQWVASSSNDRTVRIWDASTMASVAVLNGHNDYVTCVAFSPGGRQIASGGKDAKVRLWDVSPSWSSIDRQDGGRVTKLSYSHDGRSLLSHDKGGIFRQWDATTGTFAPIPHKIPMQMKVVSGAYAQDGSQLAFGYDDGSIRLWNCRSGTAGHILNGHSKPIRALVYSPCCRWIVSIDKGNTVRLWDLHDVKLQHFLIDTRVLSEKYIPTVCFSATGRQFAISAKKATTRLIDTGSRECVGQTKTSGIALLAYAPNDQQIAIGDKIGRIVLWDLQSMKHSAKLQGHRGWTRCIAYSPCGQWIASAGEDKTVIVWHRQLSENRKRWSRVHFIRSFFDQVGNISWNPVVPMEFVTSTSNGSVQVWKISIGEGGEAVSQMVWGSDLDILCTDGVTFKNTIGLSPINQEFLVQRGILCPSDESTYPDD